MTDGPRVGVATSVRDRLPSSSRYELLVKVASGGMATVYVGRLAGAAGFWRLVAIKRAHPHLLDDAAGVRMLVTEARLASKIHHPNVVSVQDVEELEGELLLVMDYVEGASLSALIARAEDQRTTIPLRVVLRVLLDAAAGLHAAHALADDNGRALGLVHRDVSPHNVLIGIDGVARLADFGIAKVSQTGSSGAGTATGALKGKVAYMAPEYVEAGEIDARSDVFALGVVAWEAITRRRLFRGNNDIETLQMVYIADVSPPSVVAPWVTPKLDAVVLKALARAPEDRYATASEFADALEAVARAESLLATPAEVTATVRELVGPILASRRALVRARLPAETSDSRDVDPVTGSIPIFVDGEPRTLTLPASIPPDGPPRASEITTLGSGAAARSMNAPPLPKRSRTIPAIALALGISSVIALFVVSQSHPKTGAVPSPAAEAQSSPSPIASAFSSAAPTAIAAPTPPATTTAPTTQSAAPTTSTTPSVSSPAKVRSPHAHPPPPTTAHPQDKAPPNPYAQ
jgi:serine/threonine-protein kinase